ncbi:MAG: methylated-DNA--[protein]-cysteine S-methyltransferase [Lachnospiraceae bacterium]|nr:methylated-DNA--[protein]-cysteine S-methyltransferase [Lachnospiraceae bacterium]
MIQNTNQPHNAPIYICCYDSPLGKMILASDGTFLTGLWFEGQKYACALVNQAVAEGKPVVKVDEEQHADSLRIFNQTKCWLDLYFSGVCPDFTPPLKVEGSAFRQLIAEIMLTISYGQTMTYGEIGKIAAERLGKKTMSAQAVGGAVGHNPISLIIPCHRVVGSDGSLTGYAGGIDKKRALLELESQLGKQEKSL